MRANLAITAHYGLQLILSPHPALRATFSPKGEGFTLT